jgi:threonine dehydrogenase-like Zn-dependent dehydrogenase
MNCRTAVITGIEKTIEIQTVPIPELEPGAVLIRVDAATLCGTDAHRWQGHVESKETPFVPGHETCGTVVDMRGPVRTLLDEPLRIGDRIISSYSHCGHCFFCRVARQTTLCKENIHYGVWHPERLMGGCAEYHIFPPGASVIRVPENVPAPLAASAACALRTVLHGFEQLGAIASYETVLVLGAGPLGLYAAAVARDRGAKNVYVIGAPAARLAVARAFGADEVLDLTAMPSPTERLAWVRDRTEGRGADIVFNCANSAAFLESLDMCRRGGRVVSIGHSSGPALPLDPDKLFDQISIRTVVMAEARHFYEAVTFLSSRLDKFPFDLMLSNTYPLDRTTDAMRGMADFTEVKPVIVAHA